MESLTIYQITNRHQNGRIYTDLRVTPPRPGRPMVVFSNGSGRADFDEAHRFIETQLHVAGNGTCHLRVNEHVADSAAPNPERNGTFREYPYETIGSILLSAVEFLRQQKEFHQSHFCLFGSGDGGAAALYAAATDPADISSLIISGGRVALTLSYASKITMPTLFILGADDLIGGQAMRAAHAAVRGPKEIVTIPRSGHLLREPGALEMVAEQSVAWLQKYAPPA